MKIQFMRKQKSKFFLLLFLLLAPLLLTQNALSAGLFPAGPAILGHDEVNPAEIVYIPEASTENSSWEIRDSENSLHASGSGTVISAEELKTLPDETALTATFSETSLTDELLLTSTSFSIENPLITLNTDKDTNPIHVSANKNLENSTVSYQIFLSFNIVKSADGDEVNADTFKALENGNYTLSFTEHGPYEKTHSESFSFKILGPNITASLDTDTNPTHASAMAELESSSVTWQILKGETEIDSGSGNEIGEASFRDLDGGDYFVRFTETAVDYGKTDTSTVSFRILAPKATVSIDRETNPTLGDGSQNLPDSSLSWTITQGETVYKEGTNSHLNTSDFAGLSAGNYSLNFTETSTNGQTHTASADFEILAPNLEISLDKSINPTVIEAKNTTSYADISFEILDSAGNSISGSASSSVDISYLKALAEGNYKIRFIAEDIYGKTFETEKEFTIKAPQITISKNSEKNPSEIILTGVLEEKDFYWRVLSGDTLINDGNNSQITAADLEGIEAGIYTVEATEYGQYSKENTKTTTFEVIDPKIAVSIDKETNPTSASGKALLEKSNVNWRIKDADGEVIISGDGKTIDLDSFRKLETGSYTAEFTEINIYKVTHTANVIFKIDGPLSTAKVDRENNPNKGTGTKKFSDSALTWEIFDAEDEEVLSGDGDTVSKEKFDGLKSGEYILYFTETLKNYGSTSVSSVKFTTDSPEVEIEIDSEINPTKIKGIKKFESSSLSWKIKDSDDKILFEGADEISKDILKKLAKGKYTAVFSETSKDSGKVSSIEEAFEIRDPHSEAKVDSELNPEEISSTKAAENSSVKWAIKAARTGKTLFSGEGLSVSEDTLKSLKNGKYKAEFSETTTMDKTHVSEISFEIEKEGNPTLTPEEEGEKRPTGIDEEGSPNNPKDKNYNPNTGKE